MSMFKAGDKVRRTKGPWYGVEEGDVCVVREVESSPPFGYLRLEGKGDVLFDDSCFELVVPPAPVPHKHAAIIKAWADGAEIQWFNEGLDKWENPVRNIIWYEDRRYRIKPEPKPDYILYAECKRAHWTTWQVRRESWHDVQATFDGETGKLKDVKVI